MDRELVEHVAKAIAWDDLTPKGKRECRWPQSFSDGEVGKFRMQAVCAIAAYEEYQQQQAKGLEQMKLPAEIPLTQGMVALIDEDDFDYLMQFNWHYREGYAKRADYPNKKAFGDAKPAFKAGGWICGGSYQWQWLGQSQREPANLQATAEYVEPQCSQGVC